MPTRLPTTLHCFSRSATLLNLLEVEWVYSMQTCGLDEVQDLAMNQARQLGAAPRSQCSVEETQDGGEEGRGKFASLANMDPR